LPHGDGPDSLVAQRTWWLRGSDGGWKAYAVSGARAHSGTVVAALEGIADPETAATIKGRDVAVPRSALPTLRPGEVYLADVVGLDVVDAAGRPLGRVVAMEDYGAHPVMRVRREKRDGAGAESLVPFVEPILRSVDLAGRRIEVDWELDD
jgi:16S rRNA processing protein RimM